jgi:hypothetical protein
MTPKKVFLFIFCFLLSLVSFSQDSIKHNQDSIPQKDFIDLLHQIFKSKKNKNDSTTHSSQNKYQFSILPGVGYTLQSSFVANVSGNVVYRNGPNDSTNLSVWTGGLAYTAKQQLLFSLQSDIWSKNNKWNFAGGYRLFKYPQNTYGLGGYTQETDATLVNYNFLRFYQTAFRKIKNDMYLGVGYMLDKHWNITEEKTQPTDFDLYGYRKESISSGLCLNFLSNTRDNPVNAYKGFYSNILFRYNATLLGSNNDWTALIIDLRKFIQLDRKHTVLAFWSYNWFTPSGKAPYLDLPSTAWDPFNNIGRGYTQSRFRSPNLIDLETELRFNITRNNLIGGAVFGNLQSYSEWPSNKFEKVLPGYGAGIRLKFNKHSRTNLALDYAFGINGSGGIFVNLGEVF